VSGRFGGRNSACHRQLLWPDLRRIDAPDSLLPALKIVNDNARLIMRNNSRSFPSATGAGPQNRA